MSKMLSESLSALMDNEVNELELRQLLHQNNSQELRSTWFRYQVTRSILHQESVYPFSSIADAVQEKIQQENPHNLSSNNETKHKKIIFSLGRIAVAASVAGMIVVGTKFYALQQVNSSQIDGSLVQSTTTNSFIAPHLDGAQVAGFKTQARLPLKYQTKTKPADTKHFSGYLRSGE